MSIHVMSWVMRESPATLGARLVLLALAEFAHDDGTRAFPAVETLAERARMSRKGVQGALRRLEADGEVAKTGVTAAGTVVYRVLMGGEATSPPGAKMTSSGGEAPSPNPSKDPSLSSPSSKRERAGATKPEPMGFSEWLGTHVELAGMSQAPRAGTTYRATLAEQFANLIAEGVTVEEVKAASRAICADTWMVANGHTAPDNVLRRSKIGKWIDRGLTMETAEPSKWAAFDTDDPRFAA